MYDDVTQHELLVSYKRRKLATESTTITVIKRNTYQNTQLQTATANAFVNILYIISLLNQLIIHIRE